MDTSDRPYTLELIGGTGPRTLTENQDISVRFESPYQGAKLYLGVLDQHSVPGTNSGVEHNGDIFHYPSATPFRITSYEQEDLRVGFYPVKITVGARSWMERVEVVPSQFSREQWIEMEKDLGQAETGLSMCQIGNPLHDVRTPRGKEHVERAEKALVLVRETAGGRRPGLRDLCGCYLSLVRKIPEDTLDGSGKKVIAELKRFRIPLTRPLQAVIASSPRRPEELIIRRAIADIRKGLFARPDGTGYAPKKSSTLYEYWSILELLRLFGKNAVKISGEVQYDTGEDGFPLMQEGYRIRFRRGGIIYEFCYAPTIPDRGPGNPIYTVGRHKSPDLVINLYDENLPAGDGPGFTGSIVIEIKYRRLSSFWREAHAGGGGSSLDQIYSYYNDLRSGKLLLDNGLSNPVCKVFTLSPDANRRSSLGGAVENVGFFPGSDTAEMFGRIVRIGEGRSARLRETIKEAARIAGKIQSAGKV